MAWMRLVVPIRISPSTSSKPSMRVSSWLAARTSLWEASRSRLVAITSNSSIITSDGAWASARENSSLRLASVSPWTLPTSSVADMR